MDTIYALASGPGKSGVAVVRISGPRAFAALEGFQVQLPSMRQMQLVRLRSTGGDVLDRCLVVAFPEAGSFTGEETVELHLHGSQAVVAAVMAALEEMGVARLAEPGEFTRRALLSGKLTLPEVEALGDLIAAETEVQRKQALSVMEGSLGTKVDAWRASIIRSGALLAVGIDFSDEDIPDGLADDAALVLKDVRKEIWDELQGIAAAERIRDGIRVAILGEPNVGKSTLLNAIAGREVALTSEYAGTTRDIIEVRLDLKGVPVQIFDTAGLRESGDEVEKMGISRARAMAEQSDIRIVISKDDRVPDGIVLGDSDMLVRAKDDAGVHPDGVSGVTGHGVSWLIEQIGTKATGLISQAGSTSRFRHRIALESALRSLDRALQQLDFGMEYSEFAADDLRSVGHALDELIGRVDVEHLLDDIFRNFCLGK